MHFRYRITYFLLLSCPQIRVRLSFTPCIWKADGWSRFTKCAAFADILVSLSRPVRVPVDLSNYHGASFVKVTEASLVFYARNGNEILSASIFCWNSWRSLFLKKWRIVCEVIWRNLSKVLAPWVIKKKRRKGTCWVHVFSTCRHTCVKQLLPPSNYCIARSPI